MYKYRALLVLSLFAALIGCGKQETILPTDPLTPEQQAAVKAEDAAVADEESAGYVPPSKKK